MTSRSSTGGRIAVLLACAATLAALWWNHRVRPARDAAPTPASTQANDAFPAPVQAVSAAASAAVATVASPAASAPPADLAARVDALSRSTASHDAMQAYDAVSNCLLARRREHVPPERFEGAPTPKETAAQICGDLRSDQVQARTAWLERAARAGEPDTAEMFIHEGPAGDGLLRDIDAPSFDDGMTADWLQRRDAYIDLALRHCDVRLATYLALFAQGVPADAAAARSYWYDARLVCPGKPAPVLAPLGDDPLSQRLLQGLRHDSEGRRVS